MKKHLCMAVAACGLLSLASCSEDENNIINDVPVVEDSNAQEIVLQVANTGDGLTTRAGRPLFSSEAKQSIDQVKVYIVNNQTNTIVADTLYTDWSNESNITSEPYTTGGHGRQATWKLTGDNRLPVGDNTYTAYAVGYTSQNSLYHNAIETFKGLTSTFSKFLSSSTLSENELGEEIFAGSIEISIDGEGNIDVSQDPEANVLTLHRQVAGTMGYFTSIPTVKEGHYVAWDDTNKKYVVKSATDDSSSSDYNPQELITNDYRLQLVASGISSKIYMDNFNSTFTEANEDNSNAWFVVNGVKGEDDNITSVEKIKFSGVNNDQEGYVLYTIHLKDWFPNGDVNNDGLLDEADAENPNDWNTPPTVQGASFVEGSVFAGKFLIPFAKTEGVKTLQLQLVKTASPDNEVLRTWNINLPEDDRQIYPSAGHAEVWTGETSGSIAELFPDSEIGETRDSYSIVRNHLYSIGQKMTDEVGPDDEPEILSKGQNIVLKVNDNWEMIHKMEVE